MLGTTTLAAVNRKKRLVQIRNDQADGVTQCAYRQVLRYPGKAEVAPFLSRQVENAMSRNSAKAVVFDLTPFELGHQMCIVWKLEHEWFACLQPSKKRRALSQIAHASYRNHRRLRVVGADELEDLEMVEIDSSQGGQHRVVRKQAPNKALGDFHEVAF